MAELGTIIGLIKTFAPKADPEEIEQAVSDWLDDHPEATTTVQDGSITKAKLNNELQDAVDEISSLSTEINSKADEPTGTKVAGKVYGLDSNLNPAWVDGGGVDPQDIEDAVDAWLTENITNPDSPPLDRSLSSSSAAAPADLVGAMANLQGTQVTSVLSPFVQGKISSGVIDPTATTHCYIGKLTAKQGDSIAYSRYNSKINSSNILVLYNEAGTTWIKNETLTNGSTYTFQSNCQFAVMAGVNTGATLQDAIASADLSFTATLSEASDLVEAVKAIDSKIATAKAGTMADISPQLIGISNYDDMTSVAKAVIKSVKLYDPDPTKVYCLVVAKASSGGEAKFEVYRMTAQMGFEAKVCEYGASTFDGRTFVRLEQYNSSGIRAEIALDFSVETSINISGVKYVISPSAYAIETVVEVQNVLLPSNLYVADGHPIQLFPKNLLMDRSKDSNEFVSKWDGYTPSTKLGEEVINIPYSAAGADMSVLLQFKDHLTGQYSNFGSKTVHVNPVSVATPYSIKILTIGDSFMDYPWYSSESTIHTGRGVMAFIKDYAETDSNSIEYIGTHLSYTDNGEDYYSESYGGWQEDFYVDTSKHAYEGNQIYSPFCINGTACDFASYFTNLGEVPDIVVFFLGMNGDASATNGQAIQTMITGIKAVSATTKFIVCMIPPYFQNRYLYNYAYFNGDAQKYKKNSAYLNLFDGQESNGIYMVPINAMFSAEYHYITANEAILNYNTDVKMPICRNHHPNQTGVQMIADAIYSVIQAIMAE